MKTAYALLALLVASAPSLVGAADPTDLGLTFHADAATTVADAIAHAHTVTLAAYALWPTQDVTRELVGMASHGGTVTVVLGRDAFGAAKEANEQTIAALQSAGCVEYDGPQTNRAGRCRYRFSDGASHIKVAVIDGVPYISDTNFSEAGLAVQDAIPGDRELLERAILGDTSENDHLATRKDLALGLEADVLRVRASSDVSIATESFGPGAIADAIASRASAHDHVRLLVARREYERSQREQALVNELERQGVEVRLTSSDEKLATDGPDFYLGSANATAGVPSQADWGLVARSPVLAGVLRARFDDEWSRATPATAWR